MNLIKGNSLKIVLLLLSMVIGLALLSVNFYNAYLTGELYGSTASNSIFLSSIRLIIILIFSLTYYISLSSTSLTESIFVSAFLIFSLLLEYPTAEEILTNIYALPYGVNTGAGIFLTGILMTSFSITGYELFYQNHEKTAIWRYTFLSLVISIAISVIIPKSPTGYLLKDPKIIVLVSIIYLISALYCIIHIVTNSFGLNTLKHSFMLILTAITYLKINFSGQVLNVVLSIILFVSFLSITMICRSNNSTL